MATTLGPPNPPAPRTPPTPRTPPAGSPTRSAPPPAPGGGRQRRWSLALLAVLVTVGSALAFVVLWMNAGGREPVLVLNNDVAAGQVIQDADLGVARVAADPGVELLASSARDQVVGKAARADLLAGTPLAAAAVGESEGLDAGMAVIAVPVPSEELPAGLERGDRVVLLQTPSATGELVATDPIGDGQVVDVDSDGDGSSIAVSVRVPESLLPDVASAIRTDSITVAQAGLS